MSVYHASVALHIYAISTRVRPRLLVQGWWWPEQVDAEVAKHLDMQTEWPDSVEECHAKMIEIENAVVASLNERTPGWVQ